MNEQETRTEAAVGQSGHERLRAAAKGAVESVLAPDTVYDHALVPQWTADINRRVLDTLRSSAPPRERLVAHSAVMKKSREPFYTATAALWNDATDCCTSYRWTNATVVCIVTVVSIVA